MKKHVFFLILVLIASMNTYGKVCFDEAAAQAQLKMVADGTKLFKGQHVGITITQVGHNKAEMGAAKSDVPQGKTGNIYDVVGCTYLQGNEGFGSHTPGVKEHLEVTLDSETCTSYGVNRKEAMITSYGCFNPGKGVVPQMDPDVLRKEYPIKN